MNLFRRKRSRLFDWEVPLLTLVFHKLSPRYDYLIAQMLDGIINRVHLEHTVIANYVGFSYAPGLSSKYEIKNEEFFRLSGIMVRDMNTNRQLELQIFVSSGLIMGYALPDHEKVKLDLESVDVSRILRQKLGEDDYLEIKALFDKEEMKLINPSEVYEIELQEKRLYHLFDLQDGDFIAVDKNKKFYRVTHDPFEIELVDKMLKDIVSESR